MRIAPRLRCSFSTRANLTYPSPNSPKPIPGATATLASLRRNFENPNVLHPLDTNDPVRDSEQINVGLIVADMVVAEKRIERLQKAVKSGAIAGAIGGGITLSFTDKIIVQENHFEGNKATCKSSGGWAEGKIVGVVMQMISKSQNIGYLVPVSMVQHFIDDMKDGEYNGFGELGIGTQKLENPAMRRYYGLDDNISGKLIDKILAPFYCMGFFKAPRKRMIISYVMIFFIVSFIVSASKISQPWHGIIDLGVVVGLSLGILSLLFLGFNKLRST